MRSAETSAAQRLSTERSASIRAAETSASTRLSTDRAAALRTSEALTAQRLSADRATALRTSEALAAQRLSSDRAAALRTSEALAAQRPSSQGHMKSGGVSDDAIRQAQRNDAIRNDNAKNVDPLMSPQTNVEMLMGMSRSQRNAASRAFTGSLSSPANAPLGAAWRKVANPGEREALVKLMEQGGDEDKLSRSLFNKHRKRWAHLVRNDPQALQAIRAMGGSFPEERAGGVLNKRMNTMPEIVLPDGKLLPITLDHKEQRQHHPELALDESNLRLSTRRENTVTLLQLEREHRKWEATR